MSYVVHLSVHLLGSNSQNYFGVNLLLLFSKLGPFLTSNFVVLKLNDLAYIRENVNLRHKMFYEIDPKIVG